jgi:alpha-mannosidase
MHLLCGDAVAGTEPADRLENKSLFSVDAPNVVLETVKRAESEEAFVLRFYESFGRRAPVSLQTAFDVRRARKADLLENDLEDLPATRGE